MEYHFGHNQGWQMMLTPNAVILPKHSKQVRVCLNRVEEMGTGNRKIDSSETVQ